MDLETGDDSLETLIETFKRFYFDYRRTSGEDDSFAAARETLAHHVILRVEGLADQENLDSIRSLVREYRELQESTYGSNDSVKERMEREFSEHSQQPIH